MTVPPTPAAPEPPKPAPIRALPALPPYSRGELADQLGGRASVRAGYGEPVAQGGVTVIPVARGGGALRERGQPGPGEASGESAGGGGAWAGPVGSVELRADGATYHPLRTSRTARVLVPAVAGVVGTVGPRLVRSVRSARSC